MIGTLQYHKADFAMSVSYLTGRMKVVDYSRIYVSEPIVMVMAKSRPRPPYLALIQPLKGSLWAAVLVSSITAGFVYWALHLGWKKLSGGTARSFENYIFDTWSILFEEPPPMVPENVSGQIQGYEEQMKLLLTSNHVLITWKYRIMSIIATSYTNKFGYAPTYFGQTEYFNYGGYGWAFRKNAPFRHAIDLMKQRLIEAGLIKQWVKEMLGKPKVEPCQGSDCHMKAEKPFLGAVENREDKVVLGLHHLQSIFFVLLLGCVVATVTFIGEHIYNMYQEKYQ